MAVIKGQNLRILAGATVYNLKCIAAAQSCDLRIDAIVESTGSKDVENDWEARQVTQLDWEVTCDALVTTGTDSTGTQLANLTVGSIYTLRLSQTSSTKNRTQTANALQMTGTAILTDLQVTAENRKQTAYAAKFIGDGDLVLYKKMVSSWKVNSGSTTTLSGDSITFSRPSGAFTLTFYHASGVTPATVSISSGTSSVNITSGYTTLSFASNFTANDFNINFVDSNGKGQVIGVHIS